jgi:hypothetical protein
MEERCRNVKRKENPARKYDSVFSYLLYSSPLLPSLETRLLEEKMPLAARIMSPGFNALHSSPQNWK